MFLQFELTSVADLIFSEHRPAGILAVRTTPGADDGTLNGRFCMYDLTHVPDALVDVTACVHDISAIFKPKVEPLIGDPWKTFSGRALDF